MSDLKTVAPVTKNVRCDRCNGRGEYWWGGIVNGQPVYSGVCFKCGGARVVARTTKPEMTESQQMRAMKPGITGLKIAYNAERGRLELCLQGGSNAALTGERLSLEQVGDAAIGRLQQRAEFLNEVRAANGLERLWVEVVRPQQPERPEVTPALVLSTFLVDGMETKKAGERFGYAKNLAKNPASLRPECLEEAQALLKRFAALAEQEGAFPARWQDFIEHILPSVTREQVDPPDYAAIGWVPRLVAEAEERLADQRERQQASRYVGEVGDKLDLVLTVERRRDYETAIYYDCRTEDGACVQIKSTRILGVTYQEEAGGWRGVNEGDRIRLAATVRKQKVYQGVKQTQVYRARVQAWVDSEVSA